MRIRPCIDIHDSKVKQIVGSTLHDVAGAADMAGTGGIAGAADMAEAGDIAGAAKTAGAMNPASTSNQSDFVQQNFVSGKDAAYYASLYREMNLPGGHIILLNSVHDKALYEADLAQAREALQAFPGSMQIGGGITPETAGGFLDMGASHVIVTSYVFRDGQLDEERLHEMISAVGKEHLVLDLSCKAVQESSLLSDKIPAGRISSGKVPPDGSAESAQKRYYVVTDRWQKMTKLEITAQTLDFLADLCDEFLIHAADVEGRKKGIEKELVKLLGSWQQRSHFCITYAGGVHSLEDLDVIRELSSGQMDVTVGSALKLFGGDLELEELVKQAECG